MIQYKDLNLKDKIGVYNNIYLKGEIVELNINFIKIKWNKGLISNTPCFDTYSSDSPVFYNMLKLE